MRILSILPFSPPSARYGGAERQMHSVHKGLQEKGVDVHVLADIAAVGEQFQLFEGISIWGVPFPTLTSSALRPGNLKLWMAWRSIRDTVLTQIPRPDLIQVTTFRQPAMIGCWLATAMNIPYVVRLAGSGTHGDLRFASSNWLIRHELPRMVRGISAVIALDSVTRQEAVDSGVPMERIEIIPSSPVLRRAPGKFIDPREVVFIGRLAPEKRIDTVLLAYAQLQEMDRSAPPLLIAGDGAETRRLAHLAEQLGIIDQCTFLGNVPEPEDVLDRACCLINSSESEGLPNAVLEALAFGVPVILSDIPVHRELAIAVGMEDFLFPVGDPQALAFRLRNFLRLQNGEKSILQQRCVEYARRFTPAVRDSSYLDLYNRILAARRERC